MSKKTLFKLSLHFIVLLQCLLFSNASLTQSLEKSFPQYSNIYVNDYANLLNTDAEQRIKNDLIELFSHSNIQMTVLTIPTINDYAPRSSIEAFATRLFNHWGIGDKNRNDGVLILVARNDRKMRIEIGSSYEKSWDKKMKRIIDDVFIPDFKQDNYQSGIEKGVKETIFSLTGSFPGEFNASRFVRIKNKVIQFFQQIHFLIYIIVVFSAKYIFSFIRNLWRLLPRNCSICSSKTSLLNETHDDEHLDGGQRLEEYLESVDYDVRECLSCESIDIRAYGNWFSPIKLCQSCNYKTLMVKITVLKNSTYTTTGTKQLDYHCKNCDFTDRETRTIPKKTKSSSSSSFGGGSSSGGGASGSW